jgi:hypothetical protein
VKRICIELDCWQFTAKTRCTEHERQRQQQRNADPERRERYGGTWQSESAALRAAQPWCSSCGLTVDLTVDHGPEGQRTVLCRSCHSKLEAERRRT